MVKPVTALAAIAGTILTGAALDKKYSIRHDLAQIRAGRRQRKHYEQLNREYGDSDWSFYHVLHHNYGQNDYDEAFLFEDRSWTYAQCRAEVGRLALELQRMGIGNRTVVGMMINNSPEFYFMWWALFKIGAIPAPVSTSVAQEPFRHCLRITDIEFLFVSYELYGIVASSLGLDGTSAFESGAYSNSEVPSLKLISIYDYGTYPASPSLATGVGVLKHNELESVNASMGAWPLESRPKLGPTDVSQYLFTSGTTGLPKAATFPTGFCHMGACPWRWPHMFEKKRRCYLCTPMFHGGATYALLPAVVRSGGCIILARKFSVRNFWHDIRRTRTDLLFYIGEMVRFLIQAPPDPVHPDETKTHNLEIIYGLGIGAPVWREFRRRFGVPWVSEYYGATEGTNAISYSHTSDSQPVAKVAHFGPLMRSRWFGQDTFFILRADMETGELIRNQKTGLCIQAAYGEVGEAVNRIKPPLQRSHDYVGRDGGAATSKKIIHDVFVKGDTFVRMGDALSMDRDGYVTFIDRLGDTYRAKGHNISTAEVEMAFINHPHISSANVYAIPMTQFGYDGQLGSAAITFRNGASADGPTEIEKESVRGLEEYLTSTAGLAGYAVPRFLRVAVDVDEAEAKERERIALSDSVGNEQVSAILKKLKTSLRKEAFSPPSDCKDRIYWIEKEGQGYVPLTNNTRQGLVAGTARL